MDCLGIIKLCRYENYLKKFKIYCQNKMTF